MNSDEIIDYLWSKDTSTALDYEIWIPSDGSATRKKFETNFKRLGEGNNEFYWLKHVEYKIENLEELKNGVAYVLVGSQLEIPKRFKEVYKTVRLRDKESGIWTRNLFIYGRLPQSSKQKIALSDLSSVFLKNLFHELGDSYSDQEFKQKLDAQKRWLHIDSPNPHVDLDDSLTEKRKGEILYLKDR